MLDLLFSYYAYTISINAKFILKINRSKLPHNVEVGQQNPTITPLMLDAHLCDISTISLTSTHGKLKVYVKYNKCFKVKQS